MIKKNKGLFFTILGSILFILFAGKFLIHIVGIIGALLLINYGLRLQNLPPVWILIQEWALNIKYRR
jgi:hypothetical protein